MGDGDLSNSFRERLERDMDSMQASLQQRNEANKPPPPAPESSESDDHIFGKIVDGIVQVATALINKSASS